jgi:hypothetical protein
MHRTMFFRIKSLVLVAVAVSSASTLACKSEIKRFRVSDAQGRIFGEGQIREFRPEQDELRRGRAVVVPPTGGETFIDRGYARELCREGLMAQVLMSWPESSYDFDDLRMHNDYLVRFGHSFKSLLGHDPEPVAVIGTSLGGISLASFLPFENRIRAVVMIVAGTHLAEIFSASDHRLARRQTSQSMKRIGLDNLESYVHHLQRAIRLEPAVHLPRARQLPESLHVISTRDTTVPTANQMALAKHFRNPQFIFIESSHRFTIIGASRNHRDTIVGFLSDRMPR